jgi:transposase
MSLKPQEVNPIPEETMRVAHAAFPKGNAIMRLRDALGPIYTDEQFTALFPHDGQPALSPGRLALVSVLQFARSAFPTGKPLRQYERGSTGNMRWRWKWMIRGLMRRCSASFGAV